jgi:hypothetical protein
VHVVGGDPPAQHPDQRKGARIEPGEDHHAAPGRPQPGDTRVEERGQVVHVRAAEDVVAAGRDADQVGRHSDGRLDLLVQDLVQQLAPYRQVRVAEIGRLGGQRLGRPVRPAEENAIRP